MLGEPPGPSRSNRFAPLILLGAGLLIGMGAGAMVLFGLPTLPAVISANSTDTSGPTATPAPAPIVGAPAPNFELENLDGEGVSLTSLHGQVVLINFWATWCGPCVVEMPALEQQYQTFKDTGFTVLAVNVDEPLPDVSAFAIEYDLTFSILLDPGAVVNDLYRVRAYPTTFLIDRDGYIRRLHIGSMTEAQLRDYLNEMGLK